MKKLWVQDGKKLKDSVGTQFNLFLIVLGVAPKLFFILISLINLCDGCEVA
jgi:hypothetical protein